MAKRGRKPLMRVSAKCGDSDNSNHNFDMTITRDGMAGYGYCERGHFNMKFLKPPEEALYLWLTKHRLTGGQLTGVESKLVFAAFEKWCKSKNVQVSPSYNRTNSKAVILNPKLEYDSDIKMFPDFSMAWQYSRHGSDSRYLSDND